jgi:toxin FitB
LNIVDSCGWLEMFSRGPNSTFFRKIIAEYDDLLVPSIVIYEVHKKLYSLLDRQKALDVSYSLNRGVVVELSGNIAIAAAEISCDHKIPMADAVILATSNAHDATIYTQDEHFRGFPRVKFPD